MKKLILDNFCLEFTKLLKKRPLESCALVLLICFLLGDKFEKNFAAVGSAEILRLVANQAKLELPKDLEDYTQKAYEVAQKISLKVQKRFDHERSQKPNSDLIDYNGAYDEIGQFLSPITLYSKYLKTLKQI